MDEASTQHSPHSPLTWLTRSSVSECRMQAVVVWKVAFRMFYTAVIALKDITTRKGLVMFVLFMLHKRKKKSKAHSISLSLCVLNRSDSRGYT